MKVGDSTGSYEGQVIHACPKDSLLRRSTATIIISFKGRHARAFSA